MGRRFTFAALIALVSLLCSADPSFAQFLDRWHEWGHGYGYGRSGFDIGKPGSAFSSPNWPSYYPTTPLPWHAGAPVVIINVYPAYYPPPIAANGHAYVRVHVPPGSQVSFDGSPTQQTGTDRLFETPPLDPAEDYTYRVSARWRADGQEHTSQRTVHIRAGQTVDVDFAR
jgi:uncharacterized protein (TIGR03000 family)